MAQDMKSREHQSWSSVSPGWRKHDGRLRSTFEAVTTTLLDKAGIKRGSRVLDVACGTGEPAIPAAERAGPEGRVLATDFVQGMLEFAREKAARAGLRNIEFRLVDGEQLDLPDASFDAATIRWGIMFMPDPVACLRGIHRALRPGARIALATWGPPDRNPWVAVPLAVLKRYMEVPAPAPGQTGIFAFADPARIKEVLAAAGFVDIQVEPLDVLWTGPDTGAAYFTEFIEMAGPLASLYASLPEDKKPRYAEEVAAEAERQSVRRPGVSLPGQSWVAAAGR
jgi:ubiquinone/menaquinone biosynthesis C-methylase UbiE